MSPSKVYWLASIETATFAGWKPCNSKPVTKNRGSPCKRNRPWPVFPEAWDLPVASSYPQSQGSGSIQVTRNYFSNGLWRTPQHGIPFGPWPWAFFSSCRTYHLLVFRGQAIKGPLEAPHIVPVSLQGTRVREARVKRMSILGPPGALRDVHVVRFPTQANGPCHSKERETDMAQTGTPCHPAKAGPLKAYPLKLQALGKLICYRHIAHVTQKVEKLCF